MAQLTAFIQQRIRATAIDGSGPLRSRAARRESRHQWQLGVDGLNFTHSAEAK